MRSNGLSQCCTTVRLPEASRASADRVSTVMVATAWTGQKVSMSYLSRSKPQYEELVLQIWLVFSELANDWCKTIGAKHLHRDSILKGIQSCFGFSPHKKSKGLIDFGIQFI